MAPVTILKITDSQNRVLCEFGTERPCQPSSSGAVQVVDPVDAFLITDILSDNEARSTAFGPNSVLRLDRPAAVKTGTTNDFRDNLTVGYTPELVTGVWVGNADNSEMRNISGVTGAGPDLEPVHERGARWRTGAEFLAPAGVAQYEVCADTGAGFGPACPESRRQFFAIDRPPLPAEQDLYQIIRLDRTTQRLATEFTPAGAIEEKIFKVYPERYRRWAEEHGIPQPPQDASDIFTFGPELAMRQPMEGEIVSGVVQVFGTANAPAFSSYELQYGVSHDPGAFSLPFSGPFAAPRLDGLLGEWDTRGLNPGPHTLRLVVRDTFGSEYETRVRVFVEHPTPTPMPTATWTPEPPTPEPSPTILPTDTPQPPTPSPTVVPAETAEPLPTHTLQPSDTPQPTATDTVAPTAEPSADHRTDTPLPEEPPLAADTETPTPTMTPEFPPETPFAPTATWTPFATVEPAAGSGNHQRITNPSTNTRPKKRAAYPAALRSINASHRLRRRDLAASHPTGLATTARPSTETPVP